MLVTLQCCGMCAALVCAAADRPGRSGPIEVVYLDPDDGSLAREHAVAKTRLGVSPRGAVRVTPRIQPRSVRSFVRLSSTKFAFNHITEVDVARVDDHRVQSVCIASPAAATSSGAPSMMSTTLFTGTVAAVAVHEVPPVQHRRPGREIVPLAPDVRALVGALVVSEVVHLIRGDDAQVDVAAGSEVVEDARPDRTSHDAASSLGHVLLKVRLEDRHRRERPGTHGGEGQGIAAAVRVNAEEVRAVDVHAAEHQRGAHVTLVLEQVRLEHGERGDDAGFALGGQPVELQRGCDHACEFWVRRRRGREVRERATGRPRRAECPSGTVLFRSDAVYPRNRGEGDLAGAGAHR